MIATTVMFPMTVVRTRMQQNQYHLKEGEAKYKNIIDVIAKTWRNEGMRGFFKGYLVSLMRNTPSSALFFFFFEFFKNNLPF